MLNNIFYNSIIDSKEDFSFKNVVIYKTDGTIYENRQEQETIQEMIKIQK